MNAGAVIQFGLSDSVEKPVDRIERNYRALLAIVVVLNSQRDMQSLWEAITAEITKVIPWARASVTQYDREADGFRFYVIATTMAQGAGRTGRRMTGRVNPRRVGAGSGSGSTYCC